LKGENKEVKKMAEQIMPEAIKNSFLVKTLGLTAKDAKEMLIYNIMSAEEILKLIKIN
jgi:hypothetical protein